MRLCCVIIYYRGIIEVVYLIWNIHLYILQPNLT